MTGHVLICGTSTRAAAESAARAGYRVTAIDAYADFDQHPSVRALSMPRDFDRSATAPAMARASRTIDCDAVAYLSPFENHPRAVSTLAAGRALWGNAPDTLRRVRNPLMLAAGLRNRGVSMPKVRVRSNDPNDPNDWLVKPFRSGGGQRVRRWQGEPLPRGCCLQESIAGWPGSVVFVAAGGNAVPLGVSRQLIGDPAFGSSGFRYCGNVMTAAGDPLIAGGPALVERACALARAAAAEFGLAGVNGIDFISSGGELVPIEINPRWSSSMELVEQVFGLSVFGAHASAGEAATLPRFDLPAAMRSVNAAGKAIVFARDDVVAGDTRGWLEDPTVRDVPHAGDRIRAGQPICTVLASGSDGQRCYDALVARAGRLHAEVAAWSASSTAP